MHFLEIALFLAVVCRADRFSLFGSGSTNAVDDERDSINAIPERTLLEQQATRGARLANLLDTANFGTLDMYPDNSLESLFYLTTLAAAGRPASLTFRPGSTEQRRKLQTQYEKEIRRAVSKVGSSLLGKLTKPANIWLTESRYTQLLLLRSVAPLICVLAGMDFSYELGECIYEGETGASTSPLAAVCPQPANEFFL